MKALVKKQVGYDNMEILDVDEPIVIDDLVKVKVSYAGICGTDLHAFQGKYKATVPPVILGHEFSGIVTEIGENVTKVRVGDRVVSETTFETCNECDFCKSKDYNLCSKRKGLGTQVNGGFAEYVITREESVHIVPQNISLISAALSEPLACCVHGSLEQTTIHEGETVIVFGPGSIGLLLSMVAKAKGATVILAGITKDEKRFELARSLNIDVIVDQQKEDLKEIVMKMTNNKGVDKIFECSGVIIATNKGLELVKKKGEVIQIGVFEDEYNGINTSLVFNKEIRYIGCRSQKPSSWEKAIDLMASGLIVPEQIVTKVVELQQWRDGFENSMNCEEVKVVIKIN